MSLETSRKSKKVIQSRELRDVVRIARRETRIMTSGNVLERALAVCIIDTFANQPISRTIILKLDFYFECTTGEYHVARCSSIVDVSPSKTTEQFI